jgi:hypothetical protein
VRDRVRGLMKKGKMKMIKYNILFMSNWNQQQSDKIEEEDVMEGIYDE